jgi:rSAM/selenodomain-associated transferase 1
MPISAEHNSPHEPSRARRCAIAVMAKSPRAGKVKTRLCPPLEPEEARAMSAAFLRDITENLRAAAKEAPIDGWIAYAPEGTAHLFDGLLAEGTGLLLADGSPAMPPDVQAFGRSLLHATQAMFAMGYGAAVVLNADSPTLPTARLVQTATHLLRPGSRAVLGPADDGGYYLLGMQTVQPRLYGDITWSTDLVAQQTRERAAEIGLSLVELPCWYDVDDRAALHRLLDDLHSPPLAEVPWRAPATAAYVAQLELAARLAVEA